MSITNLNNILETGIETTTVLRYHSCSFVHTVLKLQTNSITV